MQKYFIAIFAVIFQVFGLVTYTASGPDYGDLMAATAVSESLAFLLYLLLRLRLKEPNRLLIVTQFAMGCSAGLALLSLVAYLDIRGFF